MEDCEFVTLQQHYMNTPFVLAFYRMLAVGYSAVLRRHQHQCNNTSDHPFFPDNNNSSTAKMNKVCRRSSGSGTHT